MKLLIARIHALNISHIPTVTIGLNGKLYSFLTVFLFHIIVTAVFSLNAQFCELKLFFTENGIMQMLGVKQLFTSMHMNSIVYLSQIHN